MRKGCLVWSERIGIHIYGSLFLMNKRDIGNRVSRHYLDSKVAGRIFGVMWVYLDEFGCSWMSWVLGMY